MLPYSQAAPGFLSHIGCKIIDTLSAFTGALRIMKAGNDNVFRSFAEDRRYVEEWCLGRLRPPTTPYELRPRHRYAPQDEDEST